MAMRVRRNGSKFRLFAVSIVLTGSLFGGGAALAIPSSVLGPSQAGADTPVFNMTCTGIPGIGTATLSTTITGSIPATIATESSFGGAGHQWLVTIPASITDAIDSNYGVGATVTSAVTTTINATGTTQGSESETLNFGPVSSPSPGSTFLMTGTPTATPTFTGTGADVSVTPGVNISAFDIYVNSNPITPFPCSTPAPSPVIASAAGVHDTIAYVTDPGPNTVTPIDTTTSTSDTPFGFSPNEPGSIAIAPTGSTAYVSGVNSSSVTPIDLASNTVGSPITVGNQAEGLAITPNGATAYVADANDGTVTPINLTTNTAGTPITVGSGPVDVAITPNGATAYVVNSNDGTVTPITTATNTAGTPISVG